jgi:hypothetical protein
MSTRTPRLRYHCVSVMSGGYGCPAAEALRGVRLLSTDAPLLPLPDCSQPERCRCTYKHFEDRRAGPRRARERGEVADKWSASERRRSVGRRSTD